MEIRIFNSEKEVGQSVACEITYQISQKNNSVFILPTGETPLKTYESLAMMSNMGVVSFKDVTTFNLDEYKGIAEDHIERYYNFMMRNLFSKIDIKLENVNVPNSKAPCAKEECIRYEKKYRDMGCADFALIGIGNNGHIGFNEPGTPLLVTHVTDIAKSTIEANSRFFASADLVPKQAMTMGIDSIFCAKKIVLIATGESKANIIEKLLSCREPCEEIPASVLMLHKDVTIFLDEAAASKINK